MKERTIVFNGMQVNYKIVGQGPTVLILHGWGRGSDSYIEVMEELARAGFQVMVPDLPGFGKSTRPATAWGVSEYVEFVKTFSGQLNLQKFALLGHSFGGQVALKFAVAYPETLDYLILEAAAVIRRKRNISKALVRSLAKTGNALFSIWPFVVFQNIARKVFYRLLGSSDYLYMQGIMKNVREKVIGEDLSQFLSQVRVPTLILWGGRDVITPIEDAHILHQQIINSELETFFRIGHRIHQEVPEQFVHAITSFLRPQK